MAKKAGRWVALGDHGENESDDEKEGGEEEEPENDAAVDID